MAKATVKLPENFLIRLSHLNDKTDEIIPKVLKTGAEVAADKVRSNLQAVVGKNTKVESRSTGELVSALGVSPAKRDRDNNYNVKVGFKESRKDGGSNARIANILEYGKSNQPAKPFLKPAKSASQKKCIETMKDALEKEIESV